jgi:uncharacterized protein DUF3117
MGDVLIEASCGTAVECVRAIGDNRRHVFGRIDRTFQTRGELMAAMKPRTGDGPMEVTKEGRCIVMRVPLEGGGRLVVELNNEEAATLGDALKAV